MKKNEQSKTIRKSKIFFDNKGLTLEGCLELPGIPGPCPGLVLCHPHPLYGGDMDNNVIIAVSRALVKNGVACLRFNFRGVGHSEGRFDDGIGEQDDALAAVSYFKKRDEVDFSKIGILGYSFGGMVALSTGSHMEEVTALAAISPAVPVNVAANCLKPKLIVCGKDDKMIPASDILQKTEKMPEPKIVEAIPGADHFWAGHENKLSKMVAEFFIRSFK